MDFRHLLYTGRQEITTQKTHQFWNHGKMRDLNSCPAELKNDDKTGVVNHLSILQRNKHDNTITVNVRYPNVRFGKPNKKWIGFQHFLISDIRAMWFVRFILFKKLDHFIYIFSFTA